MSLCVTPLTPHEGSCITETVLAISYIIGRQPETLSVDFGQQYHATGNGLGRSLDLDSWLTVGLVHVPLTTYNFQGNVRGKDARSS